MTRQTCRLPGLEELRRGIAAVFRNTEHAGREFGLERSPNLYASTFPAEVITCRFSSGEVLRLLMKYQPGRDEGQSGYRRGLEYEGRVYHDIVSRSGLPAPRCFGIHGDQGSGQTWLVLEYVERGIRAHKSRHPLAAMARAAQWIGGFHGRVPHQNPKRTAPFLIRYDGAYYRSWARTTAPRSRLVSDDRSWVAEIYRKLDAVIEILTTAPVTVIHGEFYPENILVRRGGVYPVDWQSAAIAPGEIDLAVLTSGEWGRDVERRCELAYRRARWPNGAPEGFARRLAAARVYWPIVRLSATPTRHERAVLLRELRAAGEVLGLI